MKTFGNIRRDPVSPGKDFWHAIRVGVAAAFVIFLVTWGFVEAWHTF